MKLMLILIISINLYGVSYLNLHSNGGRNYKNSTVYINGKFASYRCSRSHKDTSKHYCKVDLRVYDGDKYISRVGVTVGTTWENDFKNAYKDKEFSFSCTYKNSINYFENCR